ncbi:MAG: hypothetical protein WBD20_05915 [Pirellulaceae bacterium]
MNFLVHQTYQRVWFLRLHCLGQSLLDFVKDGGIYLALLERLAAPMSKKGLTMKFACIPPKGFSVVSPKFTLLHIQSWTRLERQSRMSVPPHHLGFSSVSWEEIQECIRRTDSLHLLGEALQRVGHQLRQICEEFSNETHREIPKAQKCRQWCQDVFAAFDTAVSGFACKGEFDKACQELFDGVEDRLLKFVVHSSQALEFVDTVRLDLGSRIHETPGLAQRYVTEGLNAVVAEASVARQDIAALTEQTKRLKFDAESRMSEMRQCLENAGASSVTKDHK